MYSLLLSEKSGQDDSNESDSDEATTEVILHTEGLEALERAMLYVEQHNKEPCLRIRFLWSAGGTLQPLLVVQHIIGRK
jgi:hypothetical protein